MHSGAGRIKEGVVLEYLRSSPDRRQPGDLCGADTEKMLLRAAGNDSTSGSLQGT